MSQYFNALNAQNIHLYAVKMHRNIRICPHHMTGVFKEMSLISSWGPGLEQEIALMNLVPRSLTGTIPLEHLGIETFGLYQ
jgi:hypothetical protein